MNAEITRTVEFAAQSLAAARAAQRWADSARANTANREFLAEMAKIEAASARESARWLLSLVGHYQSNGDHDYAREVAELAQQVEGAAKSAEEAANAAATIARYARERDDRRAAKRAAAVKRELRREHVDHTDLIDVYVVPGQVPVIVEAVLRETHWPSGHVTGRTHPHPIELRDCERESIVANATTHSVESDVQCEVRHG